MFLERVHHLISCKYHLANTEQKRVLGKESDEVQISYDNTYFYPLILIDKAIDLILQQLSDDYDDFRIRIILKLTDIQNFW